MSRLPSIFFSNRIEVLYLQLKRTLFSGSHPLTRRIVIVPSPAMKSWLACRMAEDPELGIAAGVEVGFVDETLDKLVDLISRKTAAEGADGKVPRELEICLALEQEIRAVVADYSSMATAEQELWHPLLAYLGVGGSRASGSLIHRKSAKRILSLASTLGYLFVQYARLGSRMIRMWEQPGFQGGWQEQLWKKLETFFNPWEYPCRKFESVNWGFISEFGDLQVHLFGISYLAPLHHSFLMKLGGNVPVNYYIVSPCQKFWSDILSDKESVRLKGYWHTQQASKAQQFALEEYLRDNNPILANFGRLGREMAMQIEGSQAVTVEQYLLPAAIKDHNVYSDLLDDEVLLSPIRAPLTLLEAVQTDMALLRNPDVAGQIEFEVYDKTIQLHAAPKKIREVQVIYDALMQIVEKHNFDEEPITPYDIVVMAPNIGEYAPFIESIFGISGSALNAQIMDVGMPAENRFIQGFLHLLRMPFTRWDVVSLLRLLDYVPFQRRQRLAGEEAGILKDWIRSAGIRWGKDSCHRDELLQRDHCPRGMLEESWSGTWEHGLGRLLEGLAMVSEGEAGTEGVFAPLEGVEPAQGDLLGRLIFLLRSLLDDLRPLNEDAMLRLSDWTAYLKCLCEAYFFAGIDEEDQEGYSLLMRHIDLFGKGAVHFGDVPFAFGTIRRHLEAALQKRTSDHRETNLHAVRFCSLLPMRGVPAKVVVLMGMQDGAFPRADEHFSFNLLLKSPHADYVPSQVDLDRYLFLESLLSARKYFLISFISQALGDPKEQPPSLLVTELLAYLDKAYTLPGGRMSEVCHFKHPGLPFDKRYFCSEALFKSYSSNNYAAAQSYYCTEKKLPHAFLPAFPQYTTNQVHDEGTIDLSELTAFAKNPLRTYFNKSLGIYLESEESRTFKCEEEMELSHLDAALLSRQGLFVPLKELLERAEMTGRLPRGPFKKIGVEKVMRELDSLQAGLQKLGINTGQIFAIEFSGKYLKPIANGPVWVAPQLDIITPQGRKVKLSGKFEAVSPQGMIVFAEDKIEDAIKAWPMALAFSCLVAEHSLPVAAKVIFAKGIKAVSRAAVSKNARQLLGQYLDYYFTAKSIASPLLPDWVKPIMAGDCDELKDIFKKSVDDPFRPIYDEYLKWLGRTSSGLDFTSAAGHWQIPAQELFASLTAEWFPRAARASPSGGSDETL